MFIVFCAVKIVYICVFMTCSTYFCLCVSLVDPMKVITYIYIYIYIYMCINLIYNLCLIFQLWFFLRDETHTTVSVSDASPFISRVRGFYFCRRLFACFSLCKDTLSNWDFVRSDDGEQRIRKPRYHCLR